LPLSTPIGFALPECSPGPRSRDEMRSRSRVMHRTVAERADTVEQAHHLPTWPENPHDPADRAIAPLIGSGEVRRRASN
jgi:hypothetical protein